MAHEESKETIGKPCLPTTEDTPRRSSESPSGDIFTRGASEEQLRALREAAEAHKSAQAQVTEALGVLWSSRMDAALMLGDLDEVKLAFAQRLKFFDDCSCGPCDLRPGPMCW